MICRAAACDAALLAHLTAGCVAITTPCAYSCGSPCACGCHTDCHLGLCLVNPTEPDTESVDEMAREPQAIAELRRALGVQLTTFRQAADLTQGQLARVACCDRTTLVHIEKGRARADERFWRAVDEACAAEGVLLAAFLELEAAKAEHEQREREQRLAAVRAKASELRTRPAGDQSRLAQLAISHDAAQPAQRFLPEVISGLSEAMLSPNRHKRGPATGNDPSCLPDLTNRVRHAWQLRQQASYGELGAYLAQLIPDVEIGADRLEGDDHAAALRLVVHTYNTASSLLKRLGDMGLAFMAADRAVRTANAVDDPLLTAAAYYRLANVLLTASRLDDTRAVALHAADTISPSTAPSPLGLASWGGLLLTAAVATARKGDEAGAWELLGEARAASRLLGTEYADIHTIFGPTNVAIHGVQVAAELGNGHDAVRRGERVDAERLPPSLSERRSQFLIDLAQGHVLVGSDGAAIQTLVRAEQTAPEEVRFNPTTRYLVHTMLSRERLGATPGLRGLARRIGIEP